MLQRFFSIILLTFMSLTAKAQFTYGTSGLLRMPSADMNAEGTITGGFNHLDKDATEPHRVGYSTDSYYISATVLPWLEISYYMMLRSGTLKHADNYISQDRSFHVKLRAWKEGQGREWMPQIAIGANDPLSHSNDDDKLGMSSADANSYLSRYYIALTKHHAIKGIANMGLHAAAIYYNENKGGTKGVRPAAGADLRFATPGTNFMQKAINGLTLAAEYDGRTVNIGGNYSVWKDYIVFYGELNNCQYPCAGIQLRIRAYK